MAEPKNQRALLVRQTDEEEFLIRFKELQETNLTGKDKENISSWEQKCMRGFQGVAWNHMGLSQEQILSLSQEQFHGLEKVLEKKVRLAARMQKFALTPLIGIVGIPFFLFGPVFAISVTIGNEELGDAWAYARYRHRLRKKLGDGYSLYASYHNEYGPRKSKRSGFFP